MHDNVSHAHARVGRLIALALQVCIPPCIDGVAHLLGGDVWLSETFVRADDALVKQRFHYAHPVRLLPV